MAFTVDTIDLTLNNNETGEVLTANIYRVPGIDRDLSVAQLVMAICLKRAAELEEEIFTIMNLMSMTTTNIENLSTLEEKLVAKQESDSVGTTFADIGWTTNLPAGVSSTDNWKTWAEGSPYYITVPGLTKANIATTITNIESKLDSFNTNSQKDMIELQSKTNKRDQSYDLITAMVKSTMAADNTIASNMR